MAIQVQQMTAADPGVGFILEIQDDTEVVNLGVDLGVDVLVTEPALAATETLPAIPEKSHTFSMVIAQPLTTSEQLIFVLPYCSSTYGRETSVTVTVTIIQRGETLWTYGPISCDANPSKKFKLELN